MRLLVCSALLASGIASAQFTPPAGGGGGSGTVTSVAAGCGLAGGPVTTTGTISQTLLTAAHNGSYAILSADCGKSLTSNTAAAWTIAQAGTTGFEAGKLWTVQADGSGAITLTATTSTFYGAGSSGSVLTVAAGTGFTIFSDGANFQVFGGAVNPATAPHYFTGSGAPAIPCIQGAGLYTDTGAGNALYWCSATNTWLKVAPNNNMAPTGTFAFPSAYDSFSGVAISGAGVPTQQTAANVVSMFSTCSGTQYLGADGACHSVSNAFSAITSATNSSAAMVVGTGASLAASGSGTIAATSVTGFTAGAATLTGPGTAGTAVVGTLTTSGGIPFQNGTTGVVTSEAGITYQTSSTQASLILTKNGNSLEELRFADQGFNGGIAGRYEGNSKFYVYLGSAVYQSTPANAMISMDINDNALGLGPNNRPTSGTVTMKDGTATTGATRVSILLGAADTAGTVTETNAGSTTIGGTLQTGTGGSVAGSWQPLNPTLVGSLTSCASGSVGTRSIVSDATLATPGSSAVGSGTYTIAVQCIFNSTGSAYTWIID